MTCVSERSGSASSAMRCIDQKPAKTRAATTVSVVNLLVAQRRMSFSIMAEVRQCGSQPRFGINQERRLCRDLFAGVHAAAGLDELIALRAGHDFARLERTVL